MQQVLLPQLDLLEKTDNQEVLAVARLSRHLAREVLVVQQVTEVPEVLLTQEV
jgi:hypothetical protein